LFTSYCDKGLQRGDGVTGPLIIRQARDPQRSLYDHDDENHVVHLMDWLHDSANRKFVFHHHGDGDNKPHSILINGRGRYGNGTFMAETITPTVPLSTFTVIPVSIFFLIIHYFSGLNK
jgi:FtsP/CotA-like multicopper oxidase with cupredoxin domain